MEYRLSDICIKITDGSHFSPKDDKSSNIPMFSVKDMGKYGFNYENCKHISKEDFAIMLRQDCVPKKNDILVAKDGSYLKEIFVNKVESKKAILSSIAIFRVNKDIVLPNYLCYLLKSPKIMNYTKDNCVSGSAIPRIVLKAFKDIKLDIPSIEIQKKTERVLQNIDSKIELNNKINDNLQELARNMYIKEFADKKVNGKLKDLINYKKRNIKVSDKNKELDYFPIDTLPMNYLVTQKGKSNKEANSSLIEFEKYDILLGAMRVYFHRVCLASEKGITRNTTFVFTPKISGYLFYCLLLIDRNEFIEYANKTSKGSTMPYAVWNNAIAEYDIYIPFKGEAEKFNKILISLFEKMIANEKENRTLEQLRDTLLPKLMNGEIDLDKMEI